MTASLSENFHLGYHCTEAQRQRNNNCEIKAGRSPMAGLRPPALPRSGLVQRRLNQFSQENKKASEFACLNLAERTTNYCKGAANKVPANRSISIRCSGPSFCAALVNEFITPNQLASGSTR